MQSPEEGQPLVEDVPSRELQAVDEPCVEDAPARELIAVDALDENVKPSTPGGFLRRSSISSSLHSEGSKGSFQAAFEPNDEYTMRVLLVAALQLLLAGTIVAVFVALPTETADRIAEVVLAAAALLVFVTLSVAKYNAEFVKEYNPLRITGMAQKIERCAVLVESCNYETLSYEIGHLADQYPRISFFLLMLAPLGLCYAGGANAARWLASVSHSGGDEGQSSMQYAPMDQLLRSPAAICRRLGFAPMPYSYLLFKLVTGSFLQDAVLGTKDLDETMTAPLGKVALTFVTYQLLTMLAVYARIAYLVYSGALPGGLFDQYQVIMYAMLQGPAFEGVILLSCKMLVETNLSVLGSALSLDGLREYGLPQFGPAATKGWVFWVSIACCAPAVLPGGITHAVPSLLGTGVVLLFPVWGAILLIYSLIAKWIPLLPGEPAHHIMLLGAKAHAQVWGVLSILVTMMLLAMYLRRWLHSLEGKITGTLPHGGLGYSKSTMAILFATPAIFVAQSFTTWGILAFTSDIDCWSTAPFEEFDSRRIQGFNACLVSKATTWLGILNHALNWLGLI